MPKVFFSTPAVSVLKILTGPSDKPDYSVPDFVYVLLLNVKYFVSCVYAFIYGKLYVVVPLHAMVPPPPLCVEMGFTWTFPRNQDATVK